MAPNTHESNRCDAASTDFARKSAAAYHSEAGNIYHVFQSHAHENCWADLARPSRRRRSSRRTWTATPRRDQNWTGLRQGAVGIRIGGTCQDSGTCGTSLRQDAMAQGVQTSQHSLPLAHRPHSRACSSASSAEVLHLHASCHMEGRCCPSNLRASCYRGALHHGCILPLAASSPRVPLLLSSWAGLPPGLPPGQVGPYDVITIPKTKHGMVSCDPRAE